MKSTTLQPSYPHTSFTTSKQRIIQQSKQQKLQKARQLRKQSQFYQSIQQYHKVIFLQQKPQYLTQLAQIYQKQLMDIGSAILFYRRAMYLKPKNTVAIKEKLKELFKIKGLELLEMGGCKNILDNQYLIDNQENNKEGREFTQLIGEFKKVYPLFHQRLIYTYITSPVISQPPILSATHKSVFNQSKFIFNSPIKNYLQTCLAYLQVNHRQFAFGQIQNCLLIQQKNVDILILKGFLQWSMLQKQKGYKQFWNAYKINKQHEDIQLFLRLIIPKVQDIYREAKYDLIEGNVEKCKLKVSKGLEIHPYHTDLLILKAFLYRSRQQYKQALNCLQIANQNLQDKSKQNDLRGQISLTYNQMAIYLFKQQKYTQAVDLFTEGLNFKPNDYGLYTNRGDCYKAMNQFVKALEDYLRAYEYEKKSNQLNYRISGIYNMRGISLFNSKNYQLAIKQFDQSIRFTPFNEQFLLGKAKCLVQMNRKQEAVEILNEGLKHNSNMTQIKGFLLSIKQPQEKRGPNNRRIIQLSKQKS